MTEVKLPTLRFKNPGDNIYSDCTKEFEYCLSNKNNIEFILLKLADEKDAILVRKLINSHPELEADVKKRYTSFIKREQKKYKFDVDSALNNRLSDIMECGYLILRDSARCGLSDSDINEILSRTYTEYESKYSREELFKALNNPEVILDSYIWEKPNRLEDDSSYCTFDYYNVETIFANEHFTFKVAKSQYYQGGWN